MKKTVLITLIFLSVSSFSLKAQINFEKDSTTKIYVDRDNFEYSAENELTNNSSDPADTTFTWTRIENVNGWTTAVCDDGLCYPETQSTGEFNLPIDSSFKFKVNFYPDGVSGCNSVKMIIQSTLNSSNRDSSYSELCGFNSVSVNDVETKTLKLFPNPASNLVTVQYQTSELIPFSIYSILGKKVKVGVCNTPLSIEDLPSGVYIVKVSELGISKTLTKK